VHLHVVPRWSGDTNFMPVLADVKILPEYLLETRDRLRDRLRDRRVWSKARLAELRRPDGTYDQTWVRLDLLARRPD